MCAPRWSQEHMKVGHKSRATMSKAVFGGRPSKPEFLMSEAGNNANVNVSVRLWGVWGPTNGGM